MAETLPEVYLARHGETAWTVANRHTGRTDLPLTEGGAQNAFSLRDRLRGLSFNRVLISPLERARRTCELAGFAAGAEMVADLTEWDYGAYEGRRTAEIRVERPGWYIFRDGCLGGESVADVGARADRVIARLREARGRALLFGHGHFFRVLATRWIGLPAGDACHLLMNTASLSILTYEHTLDDPAIRLWNDDRHVNAEAVHDVTCHGLMDRVLRDQFR